MIDPSYYKIYFLSGDATKKMIEIDGINSLNFQKILSYNSEYALGISDNTYLLNSPQEIQLTFERSIIQNDILLQFTGDKKIDSLYVYNGTQYYQVNNLYMNSYSANFGIGDLPKVSTSFVSYGGNINQLNELPKYNNLEIEKYSQYIDIPSIDSISISGIYDLNLKTKYNVYAFDYQMTIKRQPFYSIGSGLSPIEVSLILPLEIKSSINAKLVRNITNIDINKYDDFTSKNSDFNINVSGTGSSLLSLPIRRAKLISDSIQISNENTLEIKKDFIGYYGVQ
jgi:hypothetical protein